MPVSTTGRPAAVMSILVTANTRSAQANLAALDRQAAYSVKRSTAGAEALRRGLVGLRFAAVGLGAGVAGGIAAAVQYENAFADVRKTVDASPRAFRRLEKGFVDMSKRIPASASDLASLAGELGALGVRARDLEEFTSVAAKLATTTTMTASAAADSLARLGNIMDQHGKGSFKRMASVLTELGNKGASTEAEIAAMSLRVAGAGQQVGASTAEVQGMSAALANLGIRAEMGGSALQRVMVAMQTSIAEGGEELKLWAETAGMTPQQFAEQFKRNVPETIADFVDGLARINKEGGSVQSVLVELGKAAHTSMGEIRVSQTLQRLAGDTDAFRTSVEQATTEWTEFDALQTEFAKKRNTLSNQLTLLKNSIVAVGIELGSKFLPDLKEIVEVMRAPDLTLDEKAAAVFEKLSDLIARIVPEMVKLGGRLGLAIMKGIGQAFVQADLLEKLLIGAGALRLFGGPGVFRALGKRIGMLILPGMAAGMAAGAAGGAVGGAAGGVAKAGRGAIGGIVEALLGGAAGAGVAGFVAKGKDVLETGFLRLLQVAPKIARAAGIAGLLTGPAIAMWEGFATQSKLESENIRTRIEGQLERMGDVPILEFLTGGTDVGRNKARLEEILGIVDDLAAKGRELPVSQFHAFAREIKGMTLEPDVRTDLMALLRQASEGGRRLERDAEIYQNAFRKGMNLKEVRRTFVSDHRTIIANYGRGTAETERLSRTSFNAMARHIGDMVKRGKIDLKQAERFLESVGGSVKDLPPEFRTMESSAIHAFHKGVEAAKDFDQQYKNALGPKGAEGTINSLVGATESGMKTLQDQINKALKGLGLKGEYVNFEAARANLPQGSNGKKQRGGLAAVVPGIGTGDSHTLSIDGVPQAKVESREGIFVGNREMMKRAALANSMYPRFQEGGGLDFALGPYDIPPIRYDAAHADGNAHVHISGSPPSWVVGIGRRLQQMGFTVGEHPAFGGVGGGHAHYGPTDHYHGGAIDVNSSARLVESRGEVAQIARILGGAGVAGAAVKLARVLLAGPDGPLRDVGQAALDKAWGAGKDFLAKKAPSEIGIGGVSGPLQKIAQRLVRAAWGQSQWPPFNELVDRESSWNPSAVNPSSGAAGLAQALPASKYPPGAWPYTGKQSAILQLQWMIDYIRGRYGTPAEALSFHDANNFYQRGGLLRLNGGGAVNVGGATLPIAEGVSFVANGGGGGGGAGAGSFKDILDLKKYAEHFLAAPGPGERREVVGAARQRIRNRTAIPFLDEEGGLKGTLLDLREQADRAQDFADFASNMGLEDADGNLIAGSDVVGGKDQIGWLNERLNVLLELRNLLIPSSELTASGIKAVERLIDKIKGPKGILKDIQERLRDLRKTLQDLEKEKKDLEQQLTDAETSQEKSRNELQRELDKELEKPQNKPPPKGQDKDKIERLRNQIHAGPGSEKEQIQLLLDENRKQRQNVNDRIARNDDLRLSLQDSGPIQTTVTERLDAITAGQEALIEELRTVQGSGVTMDYPITEHPSIGTLLGEYGDTQLDLRDLNAPPEPADIKGMSIQDLVEFAQAVRLGAFAGVGGPTPQQFAGVFATGGLIPAHKFGLVGERGPEFVRGPAQVTGAVDTQAALNPMIFVDVYIGGEKIEERVEAKVRGHERAKGLAARAGTLSVSGALNLGVGGDQ